MTFHRTKVEEFLVARMIQPIASCKQKVVIAKIDAMHAETFYPLERFKMEYVHADKD